MRLLDEMELFLTEEKDNYNLYPVDYDLDSGVSFGVDRADSEDVLAKIAIKSIDGNPVDALNTDYRYDDVYADVSLEGDTDDPDNADLMLWVLRKLKNMGYDEQTIRIDGEDYYKKPESISDVAVNDDVPAQSSDSEFDPSSYWKDQDEDESDISDTLEKDDTEPPAYTIPSKPEEDEDEEDEEEEDEEA